MLNIFLGAAGVGGAWLACLAYKHGWAWVQDKLKARALALETAAKAKATELAGDLAPRLVALEGQIKTMIEQRLPGLEADIAAAKSKLGL